jgi:hypothetical protein
MNSANSNQTPRQFNPPFSKQRQIKSARSVLPSQSPPPSPPPPSDPESPPNHPPPSSP